MITWYGSRLCPRGGEIQTGTCARALLLVVAVIGGGVGGGNATIVITRDGDIVSVVGGGGGAGEVVKCSVEPSRHRGGRGDSSVSSVRCVAGGGGTRRTPHLTVRKWLLS